jgi:hypothetical protein
VLAVGDGPGKIGDIGVRMQVPSPKLQAAAGFVLANQIGRDLQKPGGHAGSAAELVARFKGFNEAILRQVLRGFAIAERSQQEAKDTRPVKTDQGLEIFHVLHGGAAGLNRLSRKSGSLHSFI